MTDSPPCETEGCPHRSHYVLSVGELCMRHANEEAPNVVLSLYAAAGTPVAAEEDPTWPPEDWGQ